MTESASSKFFSRAGDSTQDHPVRTVRTALYLDFDNVYSGLKNVDADSARRFANDPGLLLNWLSRRDENGATRRFLVRDCYLNPQVYGWCRPQFVAAGFRVIDCPSLTQQGKSSADTHIILDVVAALNHSTRYEEFIICSADADFSPLMTKLRRHDRTTVMIAAGPFSAAYEAVCDRAIGSMQLLEAFLEPKIAVPTGDLGTSDAEQADSTERVPSPLLDVTSAVQAVRERIAASDAPVPGSSAASAALRAVLEIAASNWGGAGGFAAFVRRELPELKLVRDQSGGWLLDPARHSEEKLNMPDDDGIVARVCRILRIPKFTSESYAVLFTELAQAARTQPSIGRLAADVRDRGADRDVPLGRSAVNTVVTGLVYSGINFRSSEIEPWTLARCWLSSVTSRCQQAGIELTPEDSSTIEAWILGGLD